MPFNEFVHTINMVFPYMHREQIALWNRMRNQMQNINPYHSQQFVQDLNEQRQGGVFLRSCDIIKKRMEEGKMKKEEFF